MGVRVVTPGEELNQPIRGTRMGFVLQRHDDLWSDGLAINPQIHGLFVGVIGVTVRREPRTSYLVVEGATT
jgi:hypothetical protein